MDKSLIAALLLFPSVALAQTHTMSGSNVVPSGASLTIQSGGSITAAAGSTVTGFGTGGGSVDVPRVQEAFGSILNLGRPANITEVQRATTDWIHQSTVDYERRKNTYTYTPPPMAMAPSPTPGGLAAGTQKAAPTATPKPKKK